MDHQNNVIKESNNMLAARTPGVIWILVIYTTSLIILFMSDSSILLFLLFGLLILTFSILYWFSNLLLLSKGWIYFIVQGLIVFGSTSLLSNNYIITFALFPLLLGQVVGMVGKNRMIFFIILSSLFVIASLTLIPLEDLLFYFAIIIPAVLVIVSYAAIFFKQVNMRIRTQQILHELEEAHYQVEKLTLYSERQRMARDLHDTLAQGIAGIKMQLEASNAHLTIGNHERAQHIIQLAMQGASSVLADSRIVIDDLRIYEADIDLGYILKENIQQFTTSTGIPCSLNYAIVTSISPTLTEHLSKIVSECLLNILKHSKASEVSVSVTTSMDDSIYLKIIDNGVGFNKEYISTKQGHYGLIGMKERVRILGGQIDIDSTLGEGTTVTVSIPKNGES